MNKKVSKLKKNYLLLVPLIAILGMICVGLFVSNSFAEEIVNNNNDDNFDYYDCDVNFTNDRNNSLDFDNKSDDVNIDNINNHIIDNIVINDYHSFTQKGTLKLPTGEPMSYASVEIEWSYENSEHKFIMDRTYVTTNENGYFTSTYSVDADRLMYYGFFARLTIGEVKYYATDTVGHGGDDIDVDHPVHEYIGDKTIARYDIEGYLKINNSSPINNEFGYLTAEYVESGDEDIIDNETLLPWPLDHKNGIYNISLNNKVTFKGAWFPFEDGWPDDLIFKAYANSGYYVSSVEIRDKQGNICPTSGVLTKSQYTVNFNIKPISSLHTITIGDNIESVIANGRPLSSGDVVEDGTLLQINPIIDVNYISKVYVNSSLYQSREIVATTDLNISATLNDAVNIWGVVTVNDAFWSNGRNDLSVMLYDEAYTNAITVDGALISFVEHDDGWTTSTSSDVNGNFGLGVVRGLSGTLTVSKDGFITFTKEFTSEELEDDVEINPILTVVETLKEDATAQTGDSIPFGALVMMFVFATFGFYWNTRKPKGFHVK